MATLEHPDEEAGGVGRAGPPEQQQEVLRTLGGSGTTIIACEKTGIVRRRKALRRVGPGDGCRIFNCNLFCVFRPQPDGVTYHSRLREGVVLGTDGIDSAARSIAAPQLTLLLIINRLKAV